MNLYGACFIIIIFLLYLLKCAYLDASTCVFVCRGIYTRLGYAEGSGAWTKKALVHEANYNSSLIKCDNYDSASWYKTPFWLHHPFLSHAFSSCHLLFPSLRLLPFLCKHATSRFFSKICFITFPHFSLLLLLKGIDHDLEVDQPKWD